MTTLTLKFTPRNVHYLLRDEALSGSNKGNPSTLNNKSLVIQALPTPPNRVRSDGTSQEFSVGLMDVMGKDAAGAGVLLTHGSNVFIKWATTKERIDLLFNEASLYSKDLLNLQGSVVPRFYGVFADSRNDPRFVCIVLEHLCGGQPRNVAEYSRQVMILASKLHEAGISHGQLIQKLEHVVPSERGLRIVDFSQAYRHRCLGCRPYHVNDQQVPGKNCCNELYCLEHTVGKRT